MKSSLVKKKQFLVVISVVVKIKQFLVVFSSVVKIKKVYGGYFFGG